MNLFSIFAFIVYATELVISPLPDSEMILSTYELTKPTVSFAQVPAPIATPTPEVLGASTEITKGSDLPKRSDPNVTRHARKDFFTIAVIGDSMVDTLGPDIGGLPKKLQNTYPGVFFDVKNFGVGATNIDFGSTRLTGDYDYLGEHKSSVISQKPDVVVIESFGYNPYPFDDGALDKHWLGLATMVDIIRNNLPEAKIVIAATIAPNREVFGDGVLGWDPEGKRRKVEEIKRYIENAVGFAGSQNLPLADVYHPSLQSDGNGKLAYINPGDHIHYSVGGIDLFGRILAQTIVANRLLE